MHDTKEAVIESSTNLRTQLNVIENDIRNYVTYIKGAGERALHNKGECIAHAMLALRHCEDSRMRLGKVMQYATTGVSSFDTKGGTEAQHTNSYSGSFGAPLSTK